jgi:hypothetical protein
MTPATINAALRAIADATGLDNLLTLRLGYDHKAHGWEWLVEAVTTAETLDDFATASRSYRERRGAWLKSDTGEPVRGTVAGLPALAWAQVQTHKGAQRRALSVIDLGDVRVALDEDISEWMEVAP